MDDPTLHLLAITNKTMDRILGGGERFVGERHAVDKKKRLAETMQVETLRIASYDVIAALTAALQYPHSCRRELETAMAALPRAYTAACQLDPKEEEIL